MGRFPKDASYRLRRARHGPEMLSLNDYIGRMHRSADAVEMSFAGSILREADVAGAKDLLLAAAHLDLQFAGGDKPDLIDDARMEIHLAVFPAQHPEARDLSRRAPLIGGVRKQFLELGEISLVVRAFIDSLDVGRRSLTRVDGAGALQFGLGARPIGRNIDLQQAALVADVEDDLGCACPVDKKDVPRFQLSSLP